MKNKREIKKIVKKKNKRYILQMLREADFLGINYELAYQEGKDFYFKLFKGKKYFYVFNFFLIRNLDKLSAFVVNNKKLVNKVLRERGIKTPRGFTVKEFSQIKAQMKKNKLDFPITIKPGFACGGQAVSANIQNWQTARQALDSVKHIDRRFQNKSIIIEEYFRGRDFRLLILNGKFIACAERSYPHVIGNGQDDIQELIKQQVRITGFWPCKIDWEVKRNLKKNNLTLESILAQGQELRLRENSNICTGGTSINRTTRVCDKFKKIAEKAAQEFDVQVAGVDVLTNDISNPRADYRVLEINESPGYAFFHDEHDVGKSEHTTRQILQALFNLK